MSISTMIIKIEHPKNPSKTLLILDDFTKETINSFEEVLTFGELKNLSPEEKKGDTPSGNCYHAIVHNKEEIRENYIFDLNANDRRLKGELDTLFAPSLDAIIRCFLDTERVETNDTYKIWGI